MLGKASGSRMDELYTFSPKRPLSVSSFTVFDVVLKAFSGMQIDS